MENPMNALQKNLLEPARQLSAVSLGNMEKLINLQLSSCKVYGDIGFRQMRKLSQVSDLEKAQEFTWGQIEPLSEINKQLLSDWQDLVALNNSYKDDLKSVFKAAEETELSEASAEPKPAKKPAKPKTTKKAEPTKPAAPSTPA